MIKVGQNERVTQNRIVRFFCDELKYDYLGNWQYDRTNSNIEAEFLRKFLEKQGHSETLINKAIYEAEKVADDQSKELYYVNKEFYTALRYGVNFNVVAGQNNVTVPLIDWEEIENNNFAIAEEVTVKGENDKRPDIVLYVNGIALGVLELKQSSVSVSQGIRQNIGNQESYFIKQFFSTIQLVMAGNDTQGLRYGTTKTEENNFWTWKDDDDQEEHENLLENSLSQLCRKERLLEIIKDFIVFDGGKKKICRPNQYFGVKATQEFIRRREGGIIWHTQGSGKSLTMTMLADWIRENVTDSRVLIITDRIELDEQIERVFTDVGNKIVRTKNGKELLEKLNQNQHWLICSLVHKFRHKDEADIENFIAELNRNFSGFSPKGDIYVFVDECHRTQSGKLHEAMKKILPNSVFIGFTGTPLLKKDKLTSRQTFGRYIHTYKFDDAVKDKVILDLRYEARKIEQHLTSQQKIDDWFDVKTRNLPEHTKEILKVKWGTMQNLLSSKNRLEKIAHDIIFDFNTKDRLNNGKGNAILVSGSIYQACKFYEIFQNNGLPECAIITSYKPSIRDIKDEHTGNALMTEKLRKYRIYERMLNGKDVEVFEKEAKNKFIYEPAQMKLLIVVDKLLTGFDAPAATYLYIDKKMQDHGLFQAICRVNRLDSEDKEYGYIIDYKDLFRSLERAVSDYTTEAFENYEKADIEGLLKERLKKGKERLEEALNQVKLICDAVTPPKDQKAFRHYFCGIDTTDKNQLKNNEPKRTALYKAVASLLRAYADIATDLDSQEIGYKPHEIEQIKSDVKLYDKTREEIMIASGDFVDLKAFEADMRHLLDMYIAADDSVKLPGLEDFTLIQLIVESGTDAVKSLPKGIRESKEAVAETIENNLRKVLIDKSVSNPIHFEKLSKRLDDLIEQLRKEQLSYEKYLEKIVELTKDVVDGTSGTYPSSINSNAKRALFDYLENNEEFALAVDTAIVTTKRAAWIGDKFKEKEVKNAIARVLKEFGIDDNKKVELLDLARKQSDYR